jgi:uncharacterized surface protein with fasciclin (FAS1) repeats
MSKSLLALAVLASAVFAVPAFGQCSSGSAVKEPSSCAPKSSVVSTETPKDAPSGEAKGGACSTGEKHAKGGSCCGPKDVVATIAANEKLTTLAGLIKSSGLDKELAASDKKFTILAPTDEAFAKLPEATLESLAKPENVSMLKQVLSMHVISGEATSCCLADGQVVKSLSGELKVTIKEGVVSFNGATVTVANQTAGNGLIHTIDRVILPQG